MAKRKKTLAMRVLEGQDVPYEVLSFPEDIEDAGEVAQHAEIDVAQVYKTLVAEAKEHGFKPMLVMIPASCHLVPKKLAAATGAGRTRLARHEDAEKLTGLQTGGISALALLNRGFAIYADQRILAQERVAVSAGQRGLDVLLRTEDLLRITGADVVDVAE